MSQFEIGRIDGVAHTVSSVYYGGMKLFTRFFTSDQADATELPFSSPWADFKSVAEARDTAFVAARNDRMMAKSFTIEDEDGTLLEHWIFQESSWDQNHAQRP